MPLCYCPSTKPFVLPMCKIISVGDYLSSFLELKWWLDSYSPTAVNWWLIHISSVTFKVPCELACETCTCHLLKVSQPFCWYLVCSCNQNKNHYCATFPYWFMCLPNKSMANNCLVKTHRLFLVNEYIDWLDISSASLLLPIYKAICFTYVQNYFCGRLPF